MCGICGFINYTNLNHNHDLLKMMKRIDHRGPDDEGKFTVMKLALILVIRDYQLLMYQIKVNNQ